MKLKTVTKKSWIVYNDAETERTGLLLQNPAGYKYVTYGTKHNFAQKADVVEFFGEDVFDHITTQEYLSTTPKDTTFLHEYPVDCDSPVEISADLEANLIVYSKTATSSAYHVAGYFCLEFPKQWQPSYCPKLSTLAKYNYKGPFKTDEDMKFILTKLRKKEEVRS